MGEFSVLRIIQIVLGALIIIEALYKPLFILKIFKINLHRVNKLLYVAGGLILLILGIFGKLPRI